VNFYPLIIYETLVIIMDENKLDQTGLWINRPALFKKDSWSWYLNLVGLFVCIT
jgi:hypothetical protein